jgi:hypothetical protein
MTKCLLVFVWWCLLQVLAQVMDLLSKPSPSQRLVALSKLHGMHSGYVEIRGGCAEYVSHVLEFVGWC